MKIDNIQWPGAAAIIFMHVSYTAETFIGHEAHPYGLVAAILGTACFTIWSYSVGNRPQLLVNLVAIAAIVVGLFKQFG